MYLYMIWKGKLSWPRSKVGHALWPLHHGLKIGKYQQFFREINFMKFFVKLISRKKYIDFSIWRKNSEISLLFTFLPIVNCCRRSSSCTPPSLCSTTSTSTDSADNKKYTQCTFCFPPKIFWNEENKIFLGIICFCLLCF